MHVTEGLAKIYHTTTMSYQKKVNPSTDEENIIEALKVLESI